MNLRYRQIFFEEHENAHRHLICLNVCEFQIFLEFADQICKSFCPLFVGT